MAYTEVFTCDVCGQQKQETNHWFMLFEHLDKLVITTWVTSDPTAHKKAANVKHVCGEGCAQKALSKWMNR